MKLRVPFSPIYIEKTNNVITLSIRPGWRPTAGGRDLATVATRSRDAARPASRQSSYFSVAILALMFSATLVPPLSARAESPVAIAMDENYRPYMFQQAGKPAGFYYDLLRSIFDQMLVQVRFEMRPWTGAVALIDEAEAGLAGLYRNEERVRKYDFSNAIIEEQLLVYVRGGGAFRFETIADLKDKTIATIAGWSYGQAFDTARQRGVFATMETGSAAESLRKVLTGEVDAAVIESLSARIALTANPDLQPLIDTLPTPVATNKTYLAFNKQAGKTALLDYFNYVMASMKEDGRFETILLGSVDENAIIPANQ